MGVGGPGKSRNRGAWKQSEKSEPYRPTRTNKRSFEKKGRFGEGTNKARIQKKVKGLLGARERSP